MLEDVILCLFDGDSYDEWPLPISFKDLTTVNFTLVLLDCGGFMIDFGFLENEMMKKDDM